MRKSLLLLILLIFFSNTTSAKELIAHCNYVIPTNTNFSLIEFIINTKNKTLLNNTSWREPGDLTQFRSKNIRIKKWEGTEIEYYYTTSRNFIINYGNNIFYETFKKSGKKRLKCKIINSDLVENKIKKNTTNTENLEEQLQAKRFISKIFAEALINNINRYHESYTTGLGRGKRKNYLFIDKDHYEYCLTYEYKKFKCGEINWLIGRQFINNFQFNDIDTNNDMKISLEELTNNFYNKKSKKINNADFTEDYLKFFEIFNSKNYRLLSINWFDIKFAEYVKRFELSFDYENNTGGRLLREDYNADFKISLEDIKKWYFVSNFYNESFLENKKLLYDVDVVLIKFLNNSSSLATSALNANKIIKIENKDGSNTSMSCSKIEKDASYYARIQTIPAINYYNYLWNIYDKNCLERREN